jgi:hypothetical protein
MEKRRPIFGILSVAMLLLTFLGIYLGVKAHSWGGIGFAMISLVAGPICGTVLAVVALTRQERFLFLPACSLVLNLVLAACYFLSM